MTFTLTLNLSNPHFTYNRTEAIIECLEQVKRKLMMGLPEYPIWDADGQVKVGRFTIVED